MPPTDPEPTPQRIVAAGYDVIAERYQAWSGDRPSAARRTALAMALAAIPPGAEVLELGCGAGLPMTAALAEGRDVTGLDISAAQVALATRNVPAARFQHADLIAYTRPPASIDAVVAFYVLTHVPRVGAGAAAWAASRVGCGRAVSSSRRSGWRTTRAAWRSTWACRCTSASSRPGSTGAWWERRAWSWSARRCWSSRRTVRAPGSCGSSRAGDQPGAVADPRAGRPRGRDAD